MMGGTRFIGLYLARQLVEAGHEVTLFTRGKSDVCPRIPDDTDESYANFSKCEPPSPSRRLLAAAAFDLPRSQPIFFRRPRVSSNAPLDVRTWIAVHAAVRRDFHDRL